MMRDARECQFQHLGQRVQAYRLLDRHPVLAEYGVPRARRHDSTSGDGIAEQERLAGSGATIQKDVASVAGQNLLQFFLLVCEAKGQPICR